MQRNSEVDTEARFGHALQEVRSIIDEHEELCTERVQAAEAAAQGDRARFAEASEQLERERRELAGLEEQRSRLPLEAYRAQLDGDTDRESELRARYEEIKPERLDHLRGRIETLAGEVASLGGSASGAEKRALKNVRGVYASVLQSMGEVEGRLSGLKEVVAESRSKYWSGQRGVEEQMNFLRGIEQQERRAERAEAAKLEEASRHAAAGRGFRG
ncbi:MAG: hypothetical protein M3R38_30105 [Actinomycetota bacterium]|nr:hypothetical protein [Actinomycetota bacterium]